MSFISPNNPIQPRLHIETGWSFNDLLNPEAFDHQGQYLRIEAGAEYPIRHILNGLFRIQMNSFGQFGQARRDLEDGRISSFQQQSFGLNLRMGLSLFNDLLRISGGIEVGATHVNTPGCENPDRCQALFSRLREFFPLDDWGLRTGLDLGIGFFSGAINLFGRFAANSGLNPTNPDFPLIRGLDFDTVALNISEIEVGIALGLISLIRRLEGETETTRGQ